MTWSGVEELESHLQFQHDFVKDSVPAYARLLELLRGELANGLSERLEHVWQGRTFRAQYERPLLLQAALRNEALAEGANHPLHAGLVEGVPETVTVNALYDALHYAGDQDRLWHTLKTRYIQTNETSRTVTWLWLASLLKKKSPSSSIALFDIGASAGLNLTGDLLSAPWTDEHGQLLLPELQSNAGTSLEPRIVQRTGFDLNPLDPLREDDARWLLACIWPGQEHRIQRLNSALKAVQTLDSLSCAPKLMQSSVRDVPKRLTGPGDTKIAYQSLVRDYLEPQEKTAYLDGMRDWLRACPLKHWWVELELAGDTKTPALSAAITAHVSDGTELVQLTLAHCHPHPDVLHVDTAAVDEALALLKSSRKN